MIIFAMDMMQYYPLQKVAFSFQVWHPVCRRFFPASACNVGVVNITYGKNCFEKAREQADRRSFNIPRQTLHCTHTNTYVVSLMTMRLGGMAARKRPIGRKAASALRKSLKVSLPLDREKATMRRSVQLRFFLQCN